MKSCAAGILKRVLPVLLAALVAFAGWVVLRGRMADCRDDFGARHPVPAGLRCEIPAAEDAPLPQISTDRPALIIRKGVQGGIYSYEFYSPPLPDGELFRKCFEVTENIPLSVRKIESRTRQKVAGHDAFARVGSKREFTIYEGDWGEPYAVRIEVWHRNGRGSVHKLHEAVYVMEGWQR